jgi:hypothetical protein
MAKPHPFFLLLLLFLLPGSQVSAASYFNLPLTNAYQEILKLKLGYGRAQVQQQLKADQKNAAAILVANYPDFLTICVQQDPNAYDGLIAAQEQRLEKLAALQDGSEWTAYGLAEVRMQLAVSELLSGDRLAAAWDLRKAYLQYAANAKRFPDFVPNKKTLGVLQVLIGSIPDTYKPFLNIIGMKGSISAGMANLKIAATKPNPFQEEAQLLQALLIQLLDPEQNEQALQLSKQLTRKQPDNLLYNFVAIFFSKKSKESELALHYYQRRPTGKQYASFPYLHHMVADLYLYRGDYERSIEENRLFLAQHKGQHYLKSASFKLYLAYWLSGHQPQALWYYNQINEVGKEATEEDKYAAAFKDSQEQPNKYLMLARLRSDGGYYQQALAGLRAMELNADTPQPVRAEYYYRKARIYHGLKDMQQATRYYDTTIAVCGNSSLYFAPHAALQLGYIYQENNQISKARAYYNKALSYKDHAYKNSIDAKAKLALSAL